MTRQPSTWPIHLSSWIIQDGSYPDFQIGEMAEFSVEFHWKRGEPVELCKSYISAQPVASAEYEVVAEPLPCAEGTRILGIGILTYCHDLPPLMELPHSRFRTRLNLGIDPFGFWECHTPTAVLPMVYTWRIESILQQTAPHVETVINGTRVLNRDASKPGWKTIIRTDAHHDDNGRAEYILRCELLDVPAKGTSVTARP